MASFGYKKRLEGKYLCLYAYFYVGLHEIVSGRPISLLEISGMSKTLLFRIRKISN